MWVPEGVKEPKVQTKEVSKNKQDAPSKTDSKVAKTPKRVDTRRKTAKRSTVLILVATRETYANVLEKLRKEANSHVSYTKMIRARSTKEVENLIKIEGSSNKIFKDEITQR